MQDLGQIQLVIGAMFVVSPRTARALLSDDHAGRLEREDPRRSPRGPSPRVFRLVGGIIAAVGLVLFLVGG